MPPQDNRQQNNPAPQSQNQPSLGSNKLMAVLCYFGILVIIPFLTNAKNDPYVKFHIKQGLILLIANVISGFIGLVPFIGWFLIPIIILFNFVLFIIGVINAVTGKEKQLPLIGQFASHFNF